MDFRKSKRLAVFLEGAAKTSDKRDVDFCHVRHGNVVFHEQLHKLGIDGLDGLDKENYVPTVFSGMNEPVAQFFSAFFVPALGVQPSRQFIEDKQTVVFFVIGIVGSAKGI